MRSLRDLTQHLTTRADDSHAAPLQQFLRKGSSLNRSTAVQAQVRFFALRRINHMLHRLCGPPSIPLSFSLATVLPRRNTYRVSYGTAGVNSRHTKCSSFTAWTTRVSNPVCYPHFRASASVTVQVAAFATGVPPHLYAFHRYTWNSTTLSSTLAFQSGMQFPG